MEKQRARNIEAVRRLVAAEERLQQVFNVRLENPNEDPVKLFTDIVIKMKEIEVTGCPEDVQGLWQDNINACELAAQVGKTYRKCFPTMREWIAATTSIGTVNESMAFQAARNAMRAVSAASDSFATRSKEYLLSGHAADQHVAECPNCKQRVRLPKVEDSLIVTCPSCRFKWDWPEVYKPGEDDLYELLQISPFAETDVIEAAYRKLVSRYHPDRNPGDAYAARMTVILNRAREILIDPSRRAAYDQQRQDRSTSGSRGATGSDARQSADPTSRPSTEASNTPADAVVKRIDSFTVAGFAILSLIFISVAIHKEYRNYLALSGRYGSLPIADAQIINVELFPGLPWANDKKLRKDSLITYKYFVDGFSYEFMVTYDILHLELLPGRPLPDEGEENNNIAVGSRIAVHYDRNQPQFHLLANSSSLKVQQDKPWYVKGAIGSILNVIWFCSITIGTLSFVSFAIYRRAKRLPPKNRVFSSYVSAGVPLTTMLIAICFFIPDKNVLDHDSIMGYHKLARSRATAGRIYSVSKVRPYDYMFSYDVDGHTLFANSQTNYDEWLYSGSTSAKQNLEEGAKVLVLYDVTNTTRASVYPDGVSDRIQSRSKYEGPYLSMFFCNPYPFYADYCCGSITLLVGYLAGWIPGFLVWTSIRLVQLCRRVVKPVSI